MTQNPTTERFLSAHTGLVNKVLSHSFVDGPGNRAVIFLQGCNLCCLYCHNPFTRNFCNHCSVCVPHCPTGALAFVDDYVVWNQVQCTGCDTCIEVCPHDSTPKTRPVSASDLWREIAPLSSFLSGVTVSGGEPTLQLDFVSDFFTIVKRESNLNTLIETNGHVTVERLKQLLPVLDMAMVDLKATSPDLHRRLTGQSNELVKETIRFLAQQDRLYAVRKVVAPGYTDSVEDTAATARFIASVDPGIRLRFLRFRPHGVSGLARTWKSPSDETMNHLVETARAEGVHDVARSL